MGSSVEYFLEIAYLEVGHLASGLAGYGLNGYGIDRDYYFVLDIEEEGALKRMFQCWEKGNWS